MSTVHFAYTVPRSPSAVRRGFDKIIGKTAGIVPPLYRAGNDAFIPWGTPIRAPHSISYHLLHAFRERGPVKFYSIYEHVRPLLEADDIFIGSPLPVGGFGGTRTDHDDAESVTSQAVRGYLGNKRIVLMPYAHDELLVSWAKELVAAADSVIFIGGKIWEERWEELSPFRNIPIKRRTRVDMGIDPIDYPVVKTHFNPRGKRKYLYIGHTAWYKNTAELERIAERIPGFEGAHIGAGKIRGWRKLADFADLTSERMRTIAEEYDIFVNVSTADAQATTILEQMCFGMAVACTPESGYAYDSLTKLSTIDTEHNIRALETLQNADENELLSLSRENRKVALTRHSWDRFCETVCDAAGIKTSSPKTA